MIGTGAVGSRYPGWLRLFRYEVRCWLGGSIPDLGDAVGGPPGSPATLRSPAGCSTLVAAVPAARVGPR